MKIAAIRERLRMSQDYRAPARSELEQYDRVQDYRFAAAAITAAFIGLCWAVFGNPLPRVWATIKYLWECVVHVFRFYTTPTGTDIDIPDSPNSASEHFELILANLKSFAYCYQSAVGLLFNGNYATEWGYAFLNGLVKGTKWMIWLPDIIIIPAAVVASVTHYREEKAGKTKALKDFDQKVAGGLFTRIAGLLSDFSAFLHEGFRQLSRGPIMRRSSCSDGYFFKDGKRCSPVNNKHWKAYFVVDPLTSALRELTDDEYKIADMLIDAKDDGLVRVATKSSKEKIEFIKGAQTRVQEMRDTNGDVIRDRNGNPVLSDYAFDYSDSRGKSWLTAWAIIFLVFSGLGLAVADFVITYFDFIYTWSMKLLLGALASQVTDVIVFIAAIAIIGVAAIAAYVFVKVCKSEALDKLEAAQKANEAFEDGTKTVAMEITGAPIAGKTSFMTEITIDTEANLRQFALKVMDESELAFPLMDWQAVRRFVERREDYRLGKGRVENRPQLEAAISEYYKRFEEDPKREFFGFVAGMRDSFWDGSTMYGLEQAVKDYGSAYQLYERTDPLANTNFAMGFYDTRKGHYFSLYEKRGDYLKHDHRRRTLFSAVGSFDMMRWKKPFDADNSKRALAINGGGVTAFTEMAMESPNRYEAYEGNGRASKDDDVKYVSPIADGTQMYIRVIRHPLTIHNMCFNFLYFDTQKPGSVPDSIESTIENHAHIVQSFDQENALPFWDLLGGLAYWIECRFLAFSHQMKANRNRTGLFYRFVELATRPFREWYHVMCGLYGYHKLSIRREIGGTASATGIVTSETAYIINRHAYGAYMTDCYKPILDKLTLPAGSSAIDARRYKSLDITQEDLEAMGSRMASDIMATVGNVGSDSAIKAKIDAIIKTLP